MNVNVRPDNLLRQGIAQAPMLGVGPPFMQGIPQSGQQQLSPNHLGLSPNPNAANATMMLNNSAGPMNPVQQRYQAMQADIRQQRQMQMRQSSAVQHMMGPSGASMSGGGPPPHMAGLPHNQGMPFNPNMISQPPGNNSVRRASSQTSLNSGPGSLGAMSPNVNNNLAMGMNPGANITQSSMRQITPQLQHQLRMQSQQHMQSQISPDMPLTMNRQVGNPGLPSGRTGPSQAQLMNSLSQPASMPQQMGHHQNQFQNPVQIPSQHQQSQLPSPRAGSHPPSMMPTPGPSHTPVNRPQMNPDDGSMSFMGFTNPQFAQAHSAPRMPQTNGQFPPFVPSSGSPIPMAEIPQPLSGSLGTSGNTTSRPGFHPTPAQQFEQMNTAPDNYPSHFSMPPPSHAPPRPPSHNTSHPLPQQHQLRQSPHPPDPHMIPHPQRPPSQPQTIPRPPSQQAQTPRSSHSQLPPGAPPPNGRMTMPPHGPQPVQQMQMSGPSQHIAMSARPPQQLPPAPVPSNATQLQTETSSNTSPSISLSVPRPSINPSMVLGSGQQGLLRLLQFSGVLSSDEHKKLQLSFWDEIIHEYFTPKAIMKLTFWKDSQRGEAKIFEIGVPILPRFLLVTTQSGVRSMTLSLDGARERMYSAGHSIVECVGAVWTYKYANGYTVVLRGPLTVHLVVTQAYSPGTAQSPQKSGLMLRFEEFQFDANSHEKYIALESVLGMRVPESPNMARVRNSSTPSPAGNCNSNQQQQQQQQQQQLQEDKRWEEPRITIERASIPGAPVNAFGIPQATMRCLELAESVAQMADLIAFSTEADLGPIEALKRFAARIKEVQGINPLPPGVHSNNFINGANSTSNHPSPNLFNAMHANSSNMPTTPSVTLYSSAPPSVTNPIPNPVSAPTTHSPKNAPSSVGNSPQKQHKTIPQQQGQATPSSSSAPATSPTVSSGATNTPALPNASLKRKQGPDTASPATTTNEPPPKRQTRKRRTTGANGGGNAG